MNLIFDISNIFYRSYFKVLSYQNKTDHENKEHLVRKFFIDFCFICNMFEKVDSVICCFDSKSFRKTLDPNYKSDRKPNPAYFYEAFDEVNYFLKINGFIVLKHEGLEADDLIYISSEVYENNCIISNDEDIRQYLNKHTCNLTLSKKGNVLYKVDNQIFKNVLKKEYPYIDKLIDPTDVTIRKLLLGCKSDIIPKLAKRGIGEKNLQKLIDRKQFFFEKGFINTEKLLLLHNELFKDNVQHDKIESNMRLVLFQEEFDDSIFLNNDYLYNKEFKMQEILKGTKYLSE